MKLVQFILIGIAAGWILGRIRRGRGYGFLGNLIVGALGSLVGWFLAGLFKLETPNLWARIALAVLGAILLFLGLGAFKWKRKKKAKNED